MSATAPRLEIRVGQPEPEFIPSPGKFGLRSQPVVRQKVLQRIHVEIHQLGVRPSEMLLGTINDLRFRVLKPIPVHLEFRQDGVVASWQEVDEFGMGNSISIACDDLGHTIAELFHSLAADESHLGPDLEKVLAVLKEHIAHRP